MFDAPNWLDVNGWHARAEGRWHDAADHFGRAADRSENWLVERRLEFRLAEALIVTGDADSAQTRMVPMLARNPNDPEALYWMARALEHMGRGTEAAQLTSRALRALDGADPDDPITAALLVLRAS